MHRTSSPRTVGFVAVEGPARCWKAEARVKHRRLATTLLVVAALVLATLTLTSVTTARPLAAGGGPWPIDTYGLPKTTDSVILKWDEQLLNTIRAHPAQTGPTITARALEVLHTATYDAWAAYDPTEGHPPGWPSAANQRQHAGQQASGDQLRRRPSAQRPLPRPLGLFQPPNPPTPFCPTPSYKTPDTVLSGGLGYPINTTPASPTDTAATPAGVGNLAAKAVLDFRHTDGSNQLGGYSDNTYTTPNTWNSVPLTRHWRRYAS